MKRVLFVCLGNICRAGTAGYHIGEEPDPYYSNAAVFEKVLDYCEDACRGIIAWAQS